jgi:hypothetical protein
MRGRGWTRSERIAYVTSQNRRNQIRGTEAVPRLTSPIKLNNPAGLGDGKLHQATGTIVWDEKEKLPADLKRFERITVNNPRRIDITEEEEGVYKVTNLDQKEIATRWWRIRGFGTETADFMVEANNRDEAEGLAHDAYVEQFGEEPTYLDPKSQGSITVQKEYD